MWCGLQVNSIKTKWCGAIMFSALVLAELLDGPVVPEEGSPSSPLLHDLKLLDTCMLVCLFRRDFFHLASSDGPEMIPPESPPRFRRWRRSAVGTCSAASAVPHLLKLSGHHTVSVRDPPLLTLQRRLRVSRPRTMWTRK